jgi:hypothetical protein
MEDESFSSLGRYAFAAIFIAACLYRLQLGLQVAGVYIVGLSLYGWLLGKVRLVDRNWNTSGYLTGAAAQIVSIGCVLIGIIFFFYPDWVISALRAMRS